MKILGQIWSNRKMSPSLDKVESILELGSTKTKLGVRAMLGLASYYHSYFPTLAAETTHCFNHLLRKDKSEKVKWLPEHTAALEAIERRLTNTACWHHLTQMNRINFKQTQRKFC